MTTRCYRSEGVLIPGCYGAAHYGKRACTCPPRDRLAEVETRIARLEEVIAQISKNGSVVLAVDPSRSTPKKDAGDATNVI